MKMERLTDVNIVYYEVVNMMLIQKYPYLLHAKDFFKNRTLWKFQFNSYIPTNTRMVTGNSEGEGGPKSKTGNSKGWGISTIKPSLRVWIYS